MTVTRKRNLNIVLRNQLQKMNKSHFRKAGKKIYRMDLPIKIAYKKLQFI